MGSKYQTDRRKVWRNRKAKAVVFQGQRELEALFQRNPLGYFMPSFAGMPAGAARICNRAGARLAAVKRARR